MLVNELQISSAINTMCSATDTMIARLSLSFCSVAFDTIGSQKLFACSRYMTSATRRCCPKADVLAGVHIASD